MKQNIKACLLDVGLDDALQEIEENGHPRLWKLLSGAALKALGVRLQKKLCQLQGLSRYSVQSVCVI